MRITITGASGLIGSKLAAALSGRGDEVTKVSLRRGAPDPAVAHLRRALAEPPPAEARPGVLLELGLAELVSSEPLRPDTLEEAYATVIDPGARLVAAHALARTHLFAGHPAEGVAVVERAIADLPPGAEDERLGLEAVRLCAVWFGAGDPASLDELLPWRERELTTLGEKMLGASAALEAAYRGAPADVVAGCALRALAGGDVIAADNGLLSNSAIPPLAMVDREEVMDAWHDALADAHRAGSPYSISGIHIWRGYTHILRGELLDACADLEEAVEECRRFDYSANVVVYAASFLARALTERGLLGRARETLALVPQGAIGENVEGLRFFRNARLELLVASGQWDAVPAAAEEARRRIPGWINPQGHRWRSLSALALAHGNGAREEAVSLVSAELEDARRIGAPGTVGRSLRALASVSGDLSPLREAVALLEGSPARLELAKALCDLGTASDDAGMLRRSFNLALGCGAKPVAASAGAALAALGAAPAPPDDDVLTWAERRALTLARDGAGEREIAEALFLAPFEVARHLSSARAKLGT
jgi:DNA-binding CsgD family transcriptional regulator